MALPIPGSSADEQQLVIDTWREFSHHARDCQECAPARRVLASEPSSDRHQAWLGACVRGKRLLEAWDAAIVAAVEAYKDRRRARFGL